MSRSRLFLGSRAVFPWLVLAAAGIVSACSSTPEDPAPSDLPNGQLPNGDRPDAAVDPGCSGPNGCYACAPTTNSNFLNRCTTGQCSPFDNAGRLPLYDGGALPPLP